MLQTRLAKCRIECAENPMNLRFEKQPLIEVVARLTMPELVSFPFGLAFDVADELRKQYGPTKYSNPAYAMPTVAPGIDPMQLTIVQGFAPPSAIQFDSAVPNVTIQLQARMLSIKWVAPHPAAGNSSEYPGYEAVIKPELRDFFAVLSGLTGSISGVSNSNLSYKCVELQEAWTNAEFKAQFDARVSWATEDSTVVKYEVESRDEVGVYVRFLAQQVRLLGPEGSKAAYVIETGGGKLAELTPLSDPFQALDEVHESVCKMLRHMIKEEKLQQW